MIVIEITIHHNQQICCLYISPEVNDLLLLDSYGSMHHLNPFTKRYVVYHIIAPVLKDSIDSYHGRVCKLKTNTLGVTGLQFCTLNEFPLQQVYQYALKFYQTQLR